MLPNGAGLSEFLRIPSENISQKYSCITLKYIQLLELGWKKKDLRNEGSLGACFIYLISKNGAL